MSDDGRFGLTIIGFIGSVFSPYYHWSGRGEPENHCALNVALYGPRGARWAMTERGARSLRRDASCLEIGPSAMAWSDEGLSVRVRETAAPIPLPLRGLVRVRPQVASDLVVALDPAGRHAWAPLAPRAAVEVAFEQPALSWRGEGYFDMNWGAEPLEHGFLDWTWSRAHLSEGAAVLYESRLQDGAMRSLVLRFDAQGRAHGFEPPAAHALPLGIWGVPRRTRSEATPRLVRALEDAPFYTRSEISAELLGERCAAVHESLDLVRLARTSVKLMLPFRMPRIA